MTAAILKSLNNHISVKNYRIFMKFGVLQQILNLMTVKWPKIKTFKIQDGELLPSSTPFFDITQQVIVRVQQIFAIWSKIACRKRSCNINCKFRKSKMAEAAILQLVTCHLSIKKFQIRMKFGAQKQIQMKMAVTSQKFCYFKIVFWSITQHGITLFWSNLV